MPHKQVAYVEAVVRARALAAMAATSNVQETPNVKVIRAPVRSVIAQQDFSSKKLVLHLDTTKITLDSHQAGGLAGKVGSTLVYFLPLLCPTRSQLSGGAYGRPPTKLMPT